MAARGGDIGGVHRRHDGPSAGPAAGRADRPSGERVEADAARPGRFEQPADLVPGRRRPAAHGTQLLGRAADDQPADRRSMRLRLAGDAVFVTHPGHGVWFEAVVADCRRPLVRLLPSRAPGRRLWPAGPPAAADRRCPFERPGHDLGGPGHRASTRRRGRAACDSTNRFTLGGVGDVTAALDREGQDLYLYFSQYERDPGLQGVAVARLAWADRDAPVGKVDHLERRRVAPGAVGGGQRRHARRGHLDLSRRHAAGRGVAAVPRRTDGGGRLLGSVDSLEHVPRAVRDAAQPRQGRALRPGRHLRVVRTDARRSGGVVSADQDPERRRNGTRRWPDSRPAAAPTSRLANGPASS